MDTLISASNYPSTTPSIAAPHHAAFKASPTGGSAKRAKPKLAKDLIAPSYAWGLSYLIYAVSLYLGLGTVSFIVATSALTLIIKIPIILTATLLAGFGLSMLAQAGHEGMHGSMIPNKIISAVLGIGASSMVLTYFEVGFAMRHWAHHRFTNRMNDPDIHPSAHLTIWWQRVLFSRPLYNKIYFKNTIVMALGKPFKIDYSMSYSLKTQIAFARFNLIAAFGVFSAYSYVVYLNPLAGLFIIGLPHIAALIITSCQSYVDHAGLDADDLNNAYSRTSLLMTALSFGTNYHLEHHAYPHVPCYRLPRVHKLLLAANAIPNPQHVIVPSFWGAYKAVGKAYKPNQPKEDFNPFIIS